jgi:prolyl-tRNA editing enzyme YbaK/EbsC (Cys-tRNA(Pro) deacylase)
MAWPESVERVAAALRSAAVDSRIEEFSAGTPTAEAAARAVGCELGEIVKSLVFVSDGRFVLALVPGDRRADTTKVAAAAGASTARIAAPDEVRDATGFEPGAVAPFPLTRIDRVLLERSLLDSPLVWVGAGSPRHMAGLAPLDLMRLANADSVDIVS